MNACQPLAAPPAPARFDSGDFLARARARLSLDAAFVPEVPPRRGDFAFSNLAHDADFLANARPAAVLIGIVPRLHGASLILTQRAAALRDHSGQVAFPGGKIDRHDASPLAAALREAHEEIGLARACVTPLGFLEPYLTGTGFHVLPLVALVDPAHVLNIDTSEVEDAFEVPLEFLMDPANHERQSREWKGELRHFLVMQWQDRKIWGATAGMIRMLYERLYP